MTNFWTSLTTFARACFKLSWSDLCLMGFTVSLTAHNTTWVFVSKMVKSNSAYWPELPPLVGPNAEA